MNQVHRVPEAVPNIKNEIVDDDGKHIFYQHSYIVTNFEFNFSELEIIDVFDPPPANRIKLEVDRQADVKPSVSLQQWLLNPLVMKKE